SQDGIVLWDRTGYPVVSKDGVFRQIVLADGYASLVRSTNQVAAAIDTPYAIGWDAPSFSSGITLDPVDNTKIVFEEEGVYLLAFTVELLSTSANAKNAWFWPKINGADVAGSTIKTTLSSNNEYKIATRSAAFPMTAGSYLQAMWAVDDTTLAINAPAATAFAPSSPAVTLAITRLRQ
ncbi:MAG TPA: hypothetical protein VLA24_16365, partial [Pseudomonadales bacterium]|nr:hypothetical protein [Pseudomonadales bacterium]